MALKVGLAESSDLGTFYVEDDSEAVPPRAMEYDGLPFDGMAPIPLEPWTTYRVSVELVSPAESRALGTEYWDCILTTRVGGLRVLDGNMCWINGDLYDAMTPHGEAVHGIKSEVSRGSFGLDPSGQEVVTMISIQIGTMSE